MWGLISLAFVFILTYFFVGVNLVNSIKISCGISFFIFLTTTIQLTYKLMGYQLTKIISYMKIAELRSKWTWIQTIESLVILLHVLFIWTNLIFCGATVYSAGEKFWVCFSCFIMISIMAAYEQLIFLIHGLKQQ